MSTKSPENLTSRFPTYFSKVDPYNTSQSFLMKGSKNVLITNLEKVSSRQGIALQSLAGTSGSTVPGSVEWENSTGGSIPMRSLSTEARLEVYLLGSWETLMDTLGTAVNLIFDPYWDSTEKIDRMLWCDGTADAKDWSGAWARLSNITANTITCLGTQTFGQQRFLLNNTRAFRIKDDNGTWHRAAYTGGEATTTLTGVDTDLTSFPFSGGNLIVQEVITRTSLISSTFLIDFIKVVDNQVWVGSRTSNSLYVSKNTDITSYTFSTPRARGEGALLVLDGPGRGVGVLRGDVIPFSGQGFIYKSVFEQITVGTTLAETIKIDRLKTTGLQGAIHHNLIEAIGNGLAWVGNDNVLYELVDATLAYNPDLRPISDNVKPDFDAADFDGGHLKFYKTRLHLSAPNSSVSFIYEYRMTDSGGKEWFWQPPQTFPVKRWAVIDNVLCGHSAQASETYTMFTGYRDLDGPINAVIELGRWNGGMRKALKNATEMFNEGSASANCKIDVTYKFDLDGGDQQNVAKKIWPLKQPDTLYLTVQDPSLGNFSLGDISLSGDVSADGDVIPRFRLNHEINVTEFFDYGVRFETNDVDQRWEIMAHGSDAALSTNQPTAIGV